jgi:hypothetical protein
VTHFLDILRRENEKQARATSTAVAVTSGGRRLNRTERRRNETQIAASGMREVQGIKESGNE